MSRPSNSLKTKVAKHDFSAPIPPRELGSSVREQIEAQKAQPNPNKFTTPDGHGGRVWLADVIGKDQHWRVQVTEAIKLAAEATREREAKRSKFSKPVYLLGGNQRGRCDLRQEILNTELAPPLKGFRVRLCVEDEAPAIGSGRRLVLVQFRGKKVILHGDGYTATIRRDAFKELVSSNKRRRKRNQVKIDRLRADQPQAECVSVGTCPEIITTNFTEVLKGDDITIGTYPDGIRSCPHVYAGSLSSGS